jgi:two-component system sensor histidine kinase UhpB
MNKLFVGKENKLSLESSAEVLFGQFWEISVDGMRVTDEEGKILAVNEAFCRIVDKKKNELEGKMFPVIYHQNEHPKALKIYAEDLANNALKTHFEAERILWNGKKVWFEFSNSFIHLDDQVKIVLSIVNDITLRKNAEIKLQRNEKRYRMLFNNVNDAVFVNHLKCDDKFDHFIEVNDIACFRLGYTRDELKRMSLHTTIPDQYNHILSEAISELQQKNHVIFEVKQIRKDNRLIPVEINSHLFEFDNKPTVLSIARDITKRKQVESRLKNTSHQLRKLASRLQTIREEERSMIAREIHDELGQALTVLKIQVSLLANKLQKNQQKLKERSSFITEMLDNMVETVQEITAKLRPEILDQLGLTAAIEWESQQFQNHTGIKCDVNVPSNDLVLDKEKSTAIFRIFQEALTNVARHANAEKVSINLKKESERLILEVTDNGLGIRKMQIEDSSSLGLLGMRERALVLSGIVIINGVPGQGTNVKVEIPLEDS